MVAQFVNAGHGPAAGEMHIVVHFLVFLLDNGGGLKSRFGLLLVVPLSHFVAFGEDEDKMFVVGFEKLKNQGISFLQLLVNVEEAQESLVHQVITRAF
jgi:hypothetical protein